MNIACEQTGYTARLEFLTKPFYGGKPHIIQAEVFRPGAKQSFLTVRGEWNGEMRARRDKQPETVLLDVRHLPICSKRCRPVRQQHDMESRRLMLISASLRSLVALPLYPYRAYLHRLWRHVTNALYSNDIQNASRGKHWLEQRQRLQAKQRAQRQEKWQTKARTWPVAIYCNFILKLCAVLRGGRRRLGLQMAAAETAQSVAQRC